VLLRVIFPWVEEELQALVIREATNQYSTDISARKFLELLQYLRRVLLQDLALLHNNFPDSPLFSAPPFNTQVFHDYAKSAPSQVEEAECRSVQAMEDVPEYLAAGVRNAMNGLAVTHASEASHSDARLSAMESSLAEVKQLLTEKGVGLPPSKRGKGPEPSCYPFYLLVS
jgi:hypothetical protein